MLPGVLLSCSRVLLRLKRPPYPKYPTLGACRCRATKPYRRGHVHSPPTPWVLGVAWPCAWALCGHSEKVSTVFLAPHMSIHRQIWAVFLKNWGKFGCEFIVKGESKKKTRPYFNLQGEGCTPKLISEFHLNFIFNFKMRYVDFFFSPFGAQIDVRRRRP